MNLDCKVKNLISYAYYYPQVIFENKCKLFPQLFWKLGSFRYFCSHKE